MTSRIYNVTFAARDPHALARFWCEVTGGAIVRELDGIARVGGPVNLLFLRVEDPAAHSRVHLDLASTDVPRELTRLQSIGAVPCEIGADGLPLPREANGIQWYVLTDPEGNEVCLGADPDVQASPAAMTESSTSTATSPSQTPST